MAVLFALNLHNAGPQVKLREEDQKWLQVVVVVVQVVVSNHDQIFWLELLLLNDNQGIRDACRMRSNVPESIGPACMGSEQWTFYFWVDEEAQIRWW